MVRGLIAAGFNAGLGFAAPSRPPGPWFQTHRLLAVLKHTRTLTSTSEYGNVHVHTVTGSLAAMNSPAFRRETLFEMLPMRSVTG